MHSEPFIDIQTPFDRWPTVLVPLAGGGVLRWQSDDKRDLQTAIEHIVYAVYGGAFNTAPAAVLHAQLFELLKPYDKSPKSQKPA